MLEEAQVFWISTVRPDGRPHVTPCAAVWREGILYFDTGATQQKAINLRSALATQPTGSESCQCGPRANPSVISAGA